MNYFTTTSKPSNRAVDCAIVGIYDRGKLGAGASDIDSASGGEIRRLIKRGDISSKLARCTMLTNVPGIKADRVIVAGLGKRADFGAAQLRKVLAAAARLISETKVRQVLNCLSLENVSKTSRYYVARHSVEAIGEALYRFHER